MMTLKARLDGQPELVEGNQTKARVGDLPGPFQPNHSMVL